jgi:tRNA (guanine37-N1)-methyltransferase
MMVDPSAAASPPLPWTATVLSLFPQMFPGPLGHSLAGKALESGIWALESVDIRAFARNKHRSVDDTPAGGGPGMVLRADVLAEAIDTIRAQSASNGLGNRPCLYLSARGRPLTQGLARELAQGSGAVLICGRYEGVDQRVIEAREIIEVTVGDAVVSGGEVPAMMVLDAVVRLLPGVMGKAESAHEESFSQGLLEYPQYTRPQVWEGREIPGVLVSGNHGAIDAWRREEALKVTAATRPDLWALYRQKASVENKKD